MADVVEATLLSESCHHALLLSSYCQGQNNTNCPSFFRIRVVADATAARLTTNHEPGSSDANLTSITFPPLRSFDATAIRTPLVHLESNRETSVSHMDSATRQKSSLQPLKPTPLGQLMPASLPSRDAKNDSGDKQSHDPLTEHLHMDDQDLTSLDEDDGPELGYGGSHTQSWTWSSPRALQEDLYTLAKVSVERHFRGFDRDLADALKSLEKWCAHAANMKVVCINLEQRRIQEKELYKRLRAENNLYKPFDGRKLSVGHGAVLCHYTLWCQDYKTEWRRLAPWPSIAEQKWEGEDRARTKVGRYFPLPREPSNGSVPWNYLPLITSSPFDQIWKIPTEMDILYPMDQITAEVEEDKHVLLNQDILDAVELGPYDVWAKDDLPQDPLSTV